MKTSLKYFWILLAASVVLPTLVLAARTAIPLVSNLYPSGQIYLNIPAPVLTIPVAPGGGSVGAGSTLYFEVTALDGAGGETVVSNIVGTTTVANSLGFNLTWTPQVGAFGYRIYFSTSTPLTMKQYFVATTSSAYNFTSTSSPVFIPSGIPGSNTAYATNLLAAGNSWLLGGAFAIGTSTFPTGVQWQVATTTATTTAVIGAKGASGGKFILVDSSGTHSTCTEITTSAGAVSGKVVTCP